MFQIVYTKVLILLLFIFQIKMETNIGTMFDYTGSNYTGYNYTGPNYTGSNYTGSNYTGLNYTGSNYTGHGANQTKDELSLNHNTTVQNIQDLENRNIISVFSILR